MADPKLIEALSNASSLELFELSNIIDRLLADPRRIVATLNKLNLGKSVRFMDWRTGEMRVGKVMAIKGDQVTVQEDSTRSQWKLSYAGIDPGENEERLEGELPQPVNSENTNPGATTSAAATRSRSPTSTCSPRSGPSHASTNARLPSTARAAAVGACPSPCCATSWISDLHATGSQLRYRSDYYSWASRGPRKR